MSRRHDRCHCFYLDPFSSEAYIGMGMNANDDMTTLQMIHSTISDLYHTAKENNNQERRYFIVMSSYIRWNLQRICTITKQFSALLSAVAQCLDFVRWFWSFGIPMTLNNGPFWGHREGSPALHVDRALPCALFTARAEPPPQALKLFPSLRWDMGGDSDCRAIHGAAIGCILEMS